MSHFLLCVFFLCVLHLSKFVMRYLWPAFTGESNLDPFRFIVVNPSHHQNKARCCAGVGEPGSTCPEAGEEGRGSGGVQSRGPHVYQGRTAFYCAAWVNPSWRLRPSPQDDHIKQVTLKASRERDEGFEKEAEIQRLKEQRNQLKEKLQQLQEHVQRHSLYGDFLEELVKMTKVP